MDEEPGAAVDDTAGDESEWESSGGGGPPSHDDSDLTDPTQVTALLDPNCQAASCCTITPVISGTANSETLTGTASAECLVALAGNDTINAKAANDQAFGGDGTDTINANTGNDLLSGGIGADILKGEGNDDTIYGGRDNDTIYGGDGADTIYPGMGADATRAEAGNDLVVIHDGCELVSGELLDGGTGTDTLVIPMSLASVQLLGVTVTGFETITVDSSARCQAECRLPCSDIEPSFLGLSDPTIWSVDAVTGIRFRRTTTAERTANHWLPGTYLVEDTNLVNNGATGTTTLHVHLPLNDVALQRVTMTKTGASAEISKIERRVTATGLTVEVAKPTINTYLQSGFDPANPHPVSNVWIDLLTTSDGEILVEGAANSRRTKAVGSNPGWTISTVALPSGQPTITASKLVAVTYLALGTYGQYAFSQCAGPQSPTACGWMCTETFVPCGPNDHGLAQHDCNDGVDNDLDGLGDGQDIECQHHNEFSCGEHLVHYHQWESGESFAIFADGRFCTANSGTWFGELTKRGWDAEGLLNEADAVGSSANGDPRYIAGGCWIFPSVADAHACSTNGTCPVYGNTYPYKNAGTAASGYYGSVWLDAGHGAEYGLEDALHQAVSLFYGYDGTTTMGGDRHIVDLTCSGDEGSTACCGATPASPTCGQRGATVVDYQGKNANPGGCIAESSHSNIAHEIGHTLNLVHEDVHTNGVWGFMKEAGAGPGITLGAGNQAALESGLELACTARVPGFEWIGPGSCTCQ